MKNKILIAKKFLLPSFLMLFLAVSHRIKSPILAVENISQPGKLHETQATWDKHDFSSINANAQFINRLTNIPINGNGISPDARQQDSIHQVIINMVLANYLGDYNAYWKFLAPTTNYVVDNETITGMSNYYARLFPDEPAPASFEQMDRQIWNHDFSNHAYWTAVSVDDVIVTLFTTNKIPFLELDQLYPNAPYTIGSYRGCYLSYEKLLNGLLLKNGKLVIAKITVMVETIDLPKAPRPFIYVLVEDPDDNTWLPIEMGCFSTKLLKYQPRF